MQTLENFAAYILGRPDFSALSFRVQNDELTVFATTALLRNLLTFLRDDGYCYFTLLMDITAVDYLTFHPKEESFWREKQKGKRFAVAYHLLSMVHNQRIRVKVLLKEGEMLQSMHDIFPAATWYEREVFDMYGIAFLEHPDLRRILTDYNFAGYPLRKDFPTTGFAEVRYDAEQSRVAYDKVYLQQESRSFDFESPWEGMLDVVQSSAFPATKKES